MTARMERTAQEMMIWIKQIRQRYQGRRYKMVANDVYKAYS